MVYKVNLVTKDNLSEIRYITDSDVISNNVGIMAEIDAIRDIANNIMSKQPEINYADASKIARQIRNNIMIEQNKKEESRQILPGVEHDDTKDDILFNLEPSKQKVLTRNKAY